jgi:hypothetical protein
MVVLQRFYVRAGRELRRLDLTSKSPLVASHAKWRTIKAERFHQDLYDILRNVRPDSKYRCWNIAYVLQLGSILMDYAQSEL